MSTQTDTIASSDYFNDHYEGICFLNRPRIVQTKSGNKTFIAVDLAVRVGSKKDDEIRTKKVDCIVRGSRAEAIITDLLDKYDFSRSNESDKPQAPSISCWFRAGDLEADVFEYEGVTTPKLRARLLSLEFVRVSGTEGYFDDDPKFGDRRNAVSKDTGNATVESSSQAAEGSTVGDNSKPDVVWNEAAFAEQILNEMKVKLDRADPHFNEKKTYLKQNDYKFDPESKTWGLTEDVQTQ